MKRLLALLIGFTALPLVGPVPHAEALGVAACQIGGTISFTPPGAGGPHGAWRIERGVIDCKGAYKSIDRFIGQSPFTGSGSYEVLPAGNGCLSQAGTGTVDYKIRTVAGTYSINETGKFLAVGAGKIATPSLRGTFVVSPPSGNSCATEVTRTSFLAQVLLVRDPQIGVEAG